jgi:hypothetical protein
MPTSPNIRWLFLIALAATASSGCTGLTRAYNYLQPGDARYQRSLAIAHDPYPLDDVGPEIFGGRPPGFDKPLPETDRARLYNPPLRPLKPLPLSGPTYVTPAAPPGSISPWPAPPPVQTIPAPYPPPANIPPF